MKLPVVKTCIQVRYFDIDTMGHVSNSAYLQYCDLGRIDFFRDVRKVQGNDNFPFTIIVNINMDFVKEVLLKDDVHLITWCSRKGNKSMVLQQHIFANGELATKIAFTLAGWDKKHHQTVPFPEHWEISEEELLPA